MRAVIAAVLIGIVTSLRAAAPESPRPLDLFDLGAASFTTFSARDGLPDGVATSILTDRDGFVWVATSQGLARYDGQRWRLSDDAVARQPLGELFLDADGVLWCAFRERGLARYDGSHWRMEANLPTTHLRRLAASRDAVGRAVLWALSWDAGLWRREGERWVADPDNAQLPQGALLALAQTQQLGGRERLWLGTFNEGLWYREDGAWRRFVAPDFDPAQIEQLFVTTHEGREALWIAAFGGGLWRLDAGGLRSWRAARGELPGDDVYVIGESTLPDGAAAMWVATRSGLVRVYEDRVQVFDRRHGLPGDAVRGLQVWHSPQGGDVLWLATEGGVARTLVQAGHWRTASLLGARSIGVFAVHVEPDGRGGERLWVGASGDGLGLFEDGRWRVFGAGPGLLPDSNIRWIGRAPPWSGDTALWLGLHYGHLVRVDPGPRFTSVPTPWESDAGQAVMDVLWRRHAGQVERWVATRQSGLYRERAGRWTRLRPAAAQGQWRTVQLLNQVDAAGRDWLWASSEQGLARYDGEELVLLGRELGLADVDFRGLSLIPDDAGRPVLWIGTTHGGIARLRVDDPRHPQLLPGDDLPPPPDATVYSALPDRQGRIYLCSNRGVQRLTPRPGGGWSAQTYTRADGMVHEECNTNAQWVDAHDRYWTGTLGGLAVFDPGGDETDTVAKPLRLTERRLDGVAVNLAQSAVPAGVRELRIGYALLSWQREGESRFRTQLIGYEDQPGPWEAQNYRSFSGLRAGHYVLRVEARDYAGNASAPLQVPIDVAPLWWERVSVRLAGALALLVLGYAAVAWRTRSLRAQRHALELQVRERTARLSEANARLLDLSYRDALTGLANRRSLLEALESGGGAAALLFLDVDHFKDYNDRLGHPAGDEALRAVGQVLLAAAPPAALVARYGGEEFACLLPGLDAAAARDLAERIRRAVAQRDVPIPGSDALGRVTVSIGVAAGDLDGDAAAHRLLREADAALYRAKNEGRDCVRG